MKVWVGWARHSQVVNHAQCPMCGAEVGLADDSVVVDEGLEVLNGELGDGGMNSASLLSRRYSSALLDHVLRRLGMTREYAAASGGSVLFVCTHSVHAEVAWHRHDLALRHVHTTLRQAVGSCTLSRHSNFYR